jgi:hypothetical protein
MDRAASGREGIHGVRLRRWRAIPFRKGGADGPTYLWQTSLPRDGPASLWELRRSRRPCEPSTITLAGRCRTRAGIHGTTVAYTNAIASRKSPPMGATLEARDGLRRGARWRRWSSGVPRSAGNRPSPPGALRSELGSRSRYARPPSFPGSQCRSPGRLGDAPGGPHRRRAATDTRFPGSATGA